MGNAIGSAAEDDKPTTTVESTEKLDINAQIAMYQQKVDTEFSKAKDYIRKGNEKAAMMCLRQKKAFNNHIQFLKGQKTLQKNNS